MKNELFRARFHVDADSSTPWTPPRRLGLQFIHSLSARQAVLTRGKNAPFVTNGLRLHLRGRIITRFEVFWVSNHRTYFSTPAERSCLESAPLGELEGDRRSTSIEVRAPKDLKAIGETQAPDRQENEDQDDGEHDHDNDERRATGAPTRLVGPLRGRTRPGRHGMGSLVGLLGHDPGGLGAQLTASRLRQDVL